MSLKKTSIVAFLFTSLSLSVKAQKKEDNYLAFGAYHVIEDNSGVTRKLTQSNLVYSLNPTPIFTIKDIKSLVKMTNYQGYHGLTFYLKEAATENWSKVTYENRGREIGIIIQNELVAVAIINAQITGGVMAIIREEYTKKDIEKYEKLLLKEHSEEVK